MTRSNTTIIRTAEQDDSRAVAELLAEAFLHADLGSWLIPHVDTRAHIYRPYFALLTEQALNHGHVDVTVDRDTGLAAVAIWYPIAGGPPPAARNYETRLAEITGAFAHRFAALDDSQHRHHPYDSWHHYLALLGVHPDHRHQKLGSNLLARHHSELDRTGTPAYLEATGTNRRLYAQHGYLPRPPYSISSGGPLLFPMWRPPVAGYGEPVVS